MKNTRLHLMILEESIGICRFDAQTPVPEWVYRSPFYSVTRTFDELSIVCSENLIPTDCNCHRGWKCLQIAGPLNLAATGILASLTIPLARAGVSVFALSTYDTDYLMVRQKDLKVAIETLSGEGHKVDESELGGI